MEYREILLDAISKNKNIKKAFQEMETKMAQLIAKKIVDKYLKSPTPLLDEATRINRELRRDDLTESERDVLLLQRANLAFHSCQAVGEQAEKDAE